MVKGKVEVQVEVEWERKDGRKGGRNERARICKFIYYSVLLISQKLSALLSSPLLCSAIPTMLCHAMPTSKRTGYYDNEPFRLSPCR